MSPLLYWTVLTLTCGYALSKGRTDERVVAVVCIVASIVSPLVLAPWVQRYSQFEAGEFVVDVTVLGVFIAVALRSDRFWPLWIAGLQLTSSMAHLMKGVQLDLLPQAYAAAAKFWSYPILIILAIGTWRTARRRAAERSEAAAA